MIDAYNFFRFHEDDLCFFLIEYIVFTFIVVEGRSLGSCSSTFTASYLPTPTKITEDDIIRQGLHFVIKTTNDMDTVNDLIQKNEGYVKKLVSINCVLRNLDNRLASI